ncbi:DUF4145 domain-containing protein [Halorubrum sp. AJ67]|uniref:DUF4145 domain-containing protein n=1 Tax=Halorubrum sp. AJ67 TaxID=1173487 RepID=UPI00064E4A77|nr:DUF4145 domain-containing protein [Halorubrum sp. AJ67]
MDDNYVAPKYKEDGFNCPHCGAYAQIMWSTMAYNQRKIEGDISKCNRCGNYSLWMNRKLCYPRTPSASKAHEHMPDDITGEYNEARNVVDESPRAAAALLRLALQKLLENHLDTPGDGIHHDIGHLVDENEIRPRVQKMLDGVRITGNNSVHPGEMDMEDDRDTALALFKLLNYVVDETIGRDKEVEEFWDTLPEQEKEWVEDRDK